MKNFFFTRWWNKVSIAKKLYFTVGTMATLIAIELFTLFFSIHTLSSVRAYVEGEGLWSKSQKDAVYQLQRYYRTGNEEDYILFKDLMRVSIGDRTARLELMKPDPDLSIVRQGLLQGRNHPDDIDGMITLFRRFHNISYIHRAIIIWSEADPIIARLIPIGEELHKEIQSGSNSDEKIKQIMDQAGRVNQQVTLLEDSFSYTLGEGSRWLENLILKLLFAVALTVEVSGLILTISVSRGISRGLNEVIRTFKRIASGDFSTRAKVYSQDEIGTVANSVNIMTEDLLKKNREQSLAQMELRRQKDLYETLLKAQSEMGEGVAITEGQKIIYANAALCRMYGYSIEEIFSMPSFMDLVAEEDKERLGKRFADRLSGMEASDKGETTVISKDGKKINIEYSLKKISTGDKVQLVSIIRDITEKVNTENILSLQTEELRSINKELEQFAYVTSHDLQEPLRSIISYLQLLEKRYKNKLDQEADEFIHYAVDGAGRMHNLINDLLTYSRIGSRPASFEHTDFRSVYQLAMDNLHNAISENKVSIFLDSTLPVILCDKSQMIQLFQNLIANGVKFRRSKDPEIHIRAIESNTHWKFSVKDNGIGIPKEFTERVFVIFQRLHTREEYAGTGIGLAICKKIVERHGGSIWVESEPGAGSTFFFTIKK